MKKIIIITLFLLIAIGTTHGQTNNTTNISISTSDWNALTAGIYASINQSNYYQAEYSKCQSELSAKKIQLIETDKLYKTSESISVLVPNLTEEKNLWKEKYNALSAEHNITVISLNNIIQSRDDCKKELSSTVPTAYLAPAFIAGMALMYFIYRKKFHETDIDRQHHTMQPMPPRK